MQKCARNVQEMQKKKKNQTLKHFHFTKFIFLEQLTAMPQFNMQNMLLFLFVVFFFSLFLFSKQPS